MAARIHPNPKKGAFLSAYAACGTVTGAARAAGIHHSTHYEWLRGDAEYAAEFEAVGEKAADSLEEEARRRAIGGRRKPVFHNGAPIFVWTDDEGEIVEGAIPDRSTESGFVAPRSPKALHRRAVYEDRYSDTLLIFLLKGARPEKYRERHEVKGGQFNEFAERLRTMPIDEARALMRERLHHFMQPAEPVEPDDSNPAETT